MSGIQIEPNMTQKILPRKRLICKNAISVEECICALHCWSVDHQIQKIVDFVQFFAVSLLILCYRSSRFVVIMKPQQRRSRRMRENPTLIYILKQFPRSFIDLSTGVRFPANVDTDQTHSSISSSSSSSSFSSSQFDSSRVSVPKVREELCQLDVFRSFGITTPRTSVDRRRECLEEE